MNTLENANAVENAPAQSETDAIIFLKSNTCDGIVPETFSAIRESTITDLKISETYNQWGQQNDCENDDPADEEYTVRGFNFWDGHNNKTISVYDEYYNPSREIETDPKKIKGLQAAFRFAETRPPKTNRSGIETWETKNYTIARSAYVGSWELYEITPKF